MIFLFVNIEIFSNKKMIHQCFNFYFDYFLLLIGLINHVARNLPSRRHRYIPEGSLRHHVEVT